MIITRSGSTKGIFPELRGSLKAIRYPCFTEVKLDGEATLILFDIKLPKKILTTNKYGTMRENWSKLDEIALILEEKGVHEAMFLGELYFGDGRAGCLYDLLSNKENDSLNLRIYDIAYVKGIDLDMQGQDTALLDRKEILIDLFKDTEYFFHSKVCQSKQEVQDEFSRWTTLGYEGIVVKNFDTHLINGPCDWVKMKKKDQTDYEIDNIDPVKDRMDVRVPNPANNDIVLVGVRVTTNQKKGLKAGDIVTIEHQGVMDSGSLRHPVFVRKAGKEE